MVNSNEIVVHFKTNFVEGRPKSVVVPETIDAGHQLILQDGHVTYREIETIFFFTAFDLDELNNSEFIDELNSIFGDEAPSRTIQPRS